MFLCGPAQGPFLVGVHISQSRWILAREFLGGCQDIWWAGVVPLFGPSQSLLIGLGGTLSVACSLSGPPVVKQLMRVVMEKARELQKNIYFCFIDYAKALQ